MRLGILSLVAITTGCVTASTPLQTAVPTPKGRISMQAGATLPLPTIFFRKLSDLIGAAADRVKDSNTSPLTEEEEREALSSALGVLLFQPAPIVILGARYGATDDLDVGVRWASSAVRVDAKWRFAQLEGGGDVAVDVGGTHHLGIGASIVSGIYDIFDSLNLVDYSRNDLDISLIWSSDADKPFGQYLGARYSIGFIGFDSKFLDEVATQTGNQPVSADAKLHHAAGTGGLRFGSRRVQLVIELSIGRVFFEPGILGAKVDLGGWLIEPGFGLSVVF